MIKEILLKKTVKEYNSKNPYFNLILTQHEIKKNINEIVNYNIINVSEEYKIWLNKIVQICKKNSIQCIFVDQPSMYDISNLNNDKLLLWMNPPYVDYKIDFKDMIRIKNVYNDYLEGFSLQNEIKLASAVLRSKRVINFQDRCRTSLSLLSRPTRKQDRTSTPQFNKT